MQRSLGRAKPLRDDEEAIVAVVEFLSAFTLFLMILTAFMSLVQLELGSNDPHTDLLDRSAVDGLDRLTGSEGWFVPYQDGARDSSNSTKDWHLVDATELYEGAIQPGIVLDGVLDLNRVAALSKVTVESVANGLGIPGDQQIRLVIKVESSDDADRVGLIIFDGGSDRSTASTSSIASRSFIVDGEEMSVSLEVHNGADTPRMLRITEVSPRPSSGGPEWIEVENQNSFALSLRGWSFERAGTSGSMTYLYQSGVIPGGEVALFSGDPSNQELGNASVIYDLGANGFLGYGSLDGLDDNSGRLRMLFAEEGSSVTSQVCKVEWDSSSGILLDSVLVWNGGPPSSSSSWNVSNNPTPGDA